MNMAEQRIPTGILVLIAVTIAIAPIAMAIGLGVLSSRQVQAGHVTPTLEEGNQTCSNFQPQGQNWTELKIEDQSPFNWDGLDGTFDDGTLSVTITGITTAFQSPFSWSSNIGVDVVLVNGGNVGGFLFLYDPEATADTGLNTPNNPSGQPATIVNISFCYDVEATTPTPVPPATLPPATPTPAATVLPPQEFLRTYSAKFLCGTFTGDVEGAVKPGNYATAINVHNLQDEPLEFTKRAVLSSREDEPRSPPTSPITLTLDPDEALEIDCPDIRQLLGLPLGEEFIKGFGVIRSDSVEMDVVAVYTAQFLDKNVECLTKTGELEPPDEGAGPRGTTAVGVGQGGGMSIDVEYIQAKPGPPSGTGGDGVNAAALAGTSFAAAVIAVGLTVGATRMIRGSGQLGATGRDEEEEE